MRFCDNYFTTLKPEKYNKIFKKHLQEQYVRRIFKSISVLLTIELASITPVVPAASGVHAGRNRLRVDYDDVVQFSDLVVASVSNKLLS